MLFVLTVLLKKSIKNAFLLHIIGLCVIHHQDDVKGEEDMAAKKAALLEKRLQREAEAQERRQQQEQDQEQKREAARCVKYLYIFGGLLFFNLFSFLSVF